MYYIESLGNWCRSLEDIRDIIPDDVYEFIEGLINKNDEELEDKVSLLQDELLSYESSLEHYRYLLSDISFEVNRLSKDTDKQRWNKNEILYKINKIKNIIKSEEVYHIEKMINNYSDLQKENERLKKELERMKEKEIDREFDKAFDNPDEELIDDLPF